MAERSRLTVALFISILLHALSLGTGFNAWPRNMSRPAPPEFLDVDLVSLPDVVSVPAPEQAPEAEPDPWLLPETQIVSPPDAGEERPPETTRLLSDRDNTVAEEMVRRGSPGATGERGENVTFSPGDESVSEVETAAAQQAVPPPPAPAEKPLGEPSREQIAALPRLEELLPPAGEVIGDLPVPPTPAAGKGAAERKSFLAAGAKGFSSRPGITDYLPTIQEGDITLLNTKADLFAPFVRRVGARVFQHLEMRLRQAARSGGSGRGREFAQVEAIMSPEGRLLDARILKRQSDTSLSAYRELLGVASPDVFFDANPPPGAEASDGNIHFILQIDLTVDVVPDTRTGSPSTAYYGVAGVGLI